MDLNPKTELHLKQEIKQLIIEECDKQDDFAAADIDDNEPLFGRKSRIALDSLDALQLSMALKQKYAVNIEGSKDARKHMVSVTTISDLITSSANF